MRAACGIRAGEPGRAMLLTDSVGGVANEGTGGPMGVVTHLVLQPDFVIM